MDIIPVYSPGSSSTLTKVIITIYPEVGVQLFIKYDMLYLCIHTAAILEHSR